MTITTNDARDEYTSGAGQTVFNYTFKIFASDELDVYVTPAGQEANDSTDLTTDYVVDSGTIGNEAGGFITFNTPLSAGDKVTIASGIPYDRTTDYQFNGDFNPATVNNDNDRQTAQIKQVLELARKAVVFGQAQQGTSGLTSEAPESGKFIRWKSDLSGFENVSPQDVGSGVIAAEDLIIVFDTASDMASDLSGLLTVGQVALTKGKTLSGVGGGTYVVEAGDSGNGFNRLTLASGNTAVLQEGHVIELERWGVLESSADNSPVIQAAIDFASSKGGGIITSEKEDRYAFQVPIDLKSNVVIEDVKLLADLTGNPDYAIAAQGTLGTSTTITSDVNEGDVVLALTSVAGFTEGGHLIIKDPTRVGGRWPWTVAEIVDITALNVTIKQPVGVEYLLANSCTVEPMAAISNVSVRSLDMTYSDTSTSKFGVYFINTVDCSAPKLRVKNHAYTSNPTAAVTFRVDNSLNFTSDCSSLSQNPNTVGGNSCICFGVTNSKIDNVFSTDTNFGFGLWHSYGIISKGHIVSGKAASGNRGVKMAGCQQCKFESVVVNKFDSGFKIEDSGQFGVLGCTVSNCGVGGSHGINVSHQLAPSSADIRPSSIQGNTIYNIDGYGIFLDANSRQCTVDGNTTRQTELGGILCLAPDVNISDNFVYDWKAGAGIEFVGADSVTGNSLIGLTGGTDSFELNTIPSDTDWTVFSGNRCSTHGITTNPAYFEKIAVNYGNAIKDWGGRVMFAPAAPVSGTFTRGDKVYDNTPSAAGKIGFVCTGSGTPGVWKPFGAIDA